MSKKVLISLALVFLFSVSISAQQKFVANLSGLQTVPANDSGGKGVCTLTLNQAQTQVTAQCDYSGLSGPRTSYHFHGAALVGANAPILFPNGLLPGGASGSINAAFSAGPDFVESLRRNTIYIDIRTDNFPEGEIRGQIHVANSAYNDFDGDGRTDLTVYRNSNNTFYALRSLGNLYREQQIGQPGDSVSLTVDFDGDGKSDFSTARYTSDVLWRVFKSTTNTLEETHWGNSSLGDFFAAADYDGDGKIDIAVFRAGIWYILESSTGNVRYDNFGQAGDVPAPNDFDRDGKADLAVTRSEGGQRIWHILRSSNQLNYSIPWGLSSDAFFTGRADWDGDGAADISVIRNESGQRVFYIFRSSDLQLQVIRWGVSSDVVKLGDYDGDGKTDAAVTRAVNGQRVFYILQSSTGTPRYETFGLQGDF